MTTQTCYRHPDIETGLSCRICERSVCVDCVRHTSSGTKCDDCAAGREPKADSAPAAAAVANGQADYILGLVVAVTLVVVVSMSAVVVQLLAMSALAYWAKVAGARRFGLGMLYALGLLLAELMTLRDAGYGPDAPAPPDWDVSIDVALLLLAATLGLWKLLVEPARVCADELKGQGRFLQAGATVGTAIAAMLLIVAVAVLLLSAATS